jgi:FtsH-binding integral membrane protein
MHTEIAAEAAPSLISLTRLIIIIIIILSLFLKYPVDKLLICVIQIIAN